MSKKAIIASSWIILGLLILGAVRLVIRQRDLSRAREDLLDVHGKSAASGVMARACNCNGVWITTTLPCKKACRKEKQERLI